jgi:dTDP-4-dehydrorhamnose reductase
MLRIGVTGHNGQLAQSLLERGEAHGVTISPLARPDFDLLDPESIHRAVTAAPYDLLVNAAAYTAVDKAEAEPDLAMKVNAEGARHIAQAAREAGIPIIQVSTDYVFDGTAAGLYSEAAPTAPLGAYGRSKLAGEQAVAETTPDHVILRTAWVYSPTGQNFVRTMLRLGETREAVGVVADQFGSPTYAPDLADAICAIAIKLKAEPEASELRGVFHAPGGGEASWADFADAIFAGAAARGRKPVHVNRITTADYPTPAKRPQNSRLDPRKLEAIYDIRLPDWRASLSLCLDRLVTPLPQTQQETAP